MAIDNESIATIVCLGNAYDNVKTSRPAPQPTSTIKCKGVEEVEEEEEKGVVNSDR